MLCSDRKDKLLDVVGFTLFPISQSGLHKGRRTVFMILSLVEECKEKNMTSFSRVSCTDSLLGCPHCLPAKYCECACCKNKNACPVD